MLICPICRAPLMLHQRTYACQNRHSYDVSKDGHVNLHVVQHKNSHSAGDTAISVQARKRFLAQGFYAPLQDKIAQITKELSVNLVLDIGCGEGYYTAALAQHAKQVIGLDIAKPAIITAAKTHKNQEIGKRITWVVGTGAMLPVADDSVEMCTSFFSPLPKVQILNALKSGGYLLMATPAPRHLYAFRQRLFDAVRLHNPDKFIQTLAPEFVLINRWQIDAPMTLDNDSLSDLMDMTPYAYKATLTKKTALKAERKLDVMASFCVCLFQKSIQNNTDQDT